MKPETRNPRTVGPEHRTPSPTAIFGALADTRRQHTLVYLASKPAAISLGDLAEYIAIAEDQASYDWYQRILVDLHHRHLPQLVDAGLARYDATAETVELAVDAASLRPYLSIVSDDE
ncbi:DUF7344 domain-containing protein [Halovivax gelatinilyticus]|uniref:DUF7344 domain-containing protein n=1 Tax=Halovivax gelatinilyticus TaxID=2961597 RepID=UPI0020CA82E9|nr:hypothetical protein [Halovivax gelatinilyticus]